MVENVFRYFSCFFTCCPLIFFKLEMLRTQEELKTHGKHGSLFRFAGRPLVLPETTPLLVFSGCTHCLLEAYIYVDG